MELFGSGFSESKLQPSLLPTIIAVMAPDESSLFVSLRITGDADFLFVRGKMIESNPWEAIGAREEDRSIN